jgi:hypothetical protein
MLVGLPTIAVVCILADLAGNSATQPFSRGVFGVMVALELRVADSVGGVVSWAADALTTVL